MANLLQTSAADRPALLKIIRDFAVAHGWTVGVDTIDGSGQLRLDKWGHQYFFRTQTDNQTDYMDRNNIVVRQDGIIGMGIDVDFAEANCRARTNDLVGPLPSVWLFTDGDDGNYIHVVIQCNADRYGSMSFGRLDGRGLTGTKYVYYVAGNYYVWWKNWGAWDQPGNGNNAQNYPGNGSNDTGFFLDQAHDGNNPYGFRYSIDDGILDPTLGFEGGQKLDYKNHMWGVCNRWTQYSDATNYNTAQWLDYFAAVQNHPITGGIPMTAVPVFVSGSSDARVFVGELPDLRVINMGAVTPEQIVTLGNDNWQCFPLKQKGEPDNCVGGPSPQERCNSGYYGFAFKRN